MGLGTSEFVLKDFKITILNMCKDIRKTTLRTLAENMKIKKINVNCETEKNTITGLIAH